MAKDTYYIKLDTNAGEDPKIKILRKTYGIEGFGCYVFIILKMRQEEDCQLDYDEFSWEALGVDLDKDPEDVKAFVDECIRLKLFKKTGSYFYSERLSRDKMKLDEKREKTSRAGKASAAKRYGTPMPDDQDGIASMIKLYEDKTGRTLTPNEFDLMKDMFDEYGEEQFEKAVDEAVNAQAKSPVKYIAKVLENWKIERRAEKGGAYRRRSTKIPTSYSDPPPDPELEAGDETD